jgi:hypothetical protein
MGYKRFETDQRVVSVADLLQDRLENITYKPGHGSRTITSDGGTSRVYSTVLFRLLELIIMDVIAGSGILRSKCKVYVLRRLQTCITRNYIGWV